MKRVELVVAYDGTGYCGWQMQPNGQSVESVLNEQLTKLLGEPIQVIGASRTDSGVHALGNRAVFDTNTRIPSDKICFALNQRLPQDIAIQSSREVPPEFHPRHTNSTKIYQYRILNRRLPVPTKRFYTYFVYVPLNLELMQQAAGYLVGKHDFKSFCSARTQVTDTVREIYSLELAREGDEIVVTVTGAGFLYNMVRIIVGTLLKVGMHVYPPEHVAEILEARDRAAAGPKAPAQGLTLMEIRYEEEASLASFGAPV